jgi:hypothetical protein
VTKRLTVLAVITAGFVLAAYRMHESAPAGVDRMPAVQAQAAGSSSTNDDEPADTIRSFIDEAQFVSTYDAGKMEEWLEGIDDESGVDVRFIFTRNVRGSLDAYALRRARELGVGREVDKRGLLFVYDVVGERMRIEVGPGLEGAFTDAFVGYLMREQTGLFFAGGHRVLALKATLWVVGQRLREAALNEAYDERPLAFVTDSVRLASGAGATARVAVQRESGPYRPKWPAADVRARFGPQPTVEDVYARYLEALREGQMSVDLPLYAPASHSGTKKVAIRFLAAPSYAGFALSSEDGKAHTIVERGDLAIMFFTATPLVAPHLFRRTSDGWHIDIIAEHRDTSENFGGGYTWGMVLTGDDYSHAFADLYEDVDGFLRPAGGDNRPLPKPKRSRPRAR